LRYDPLGEISFVRKRESSLAFHFEPVLRTQSSFAAFGKEISQPGFHRISVGGLGPKAWTVKLKFKISQLIAPCDFLLRGIESQSLKEIIAITTRQKVLNARADKVFADTQEMVAGDATSAARYLNSELSGVPIVIEITPDRDQGYIAGLCKTLRGFTLDILFVEQGESLNMGSFHGGGQNDA